MTKKEMAMFEEMTNTIKALENRIGKLEKALKTSRTASKEVNSKKVDSKESEEPIPNVVGNLISDGKYVKTGKDYMPREVRYAIYKAITETFGGTKLAAGNPVYDKCRKLDKYVQVYEFKTVEDCQKFMADQQKRVG